MGFLYFYSVNPMYCFTDSSLGILVYFPFTERINTFLISQKILSKTAPIQKATQPIKKKVIVTVP